MRDDIAAAVTRAVAYLERVQLASGEIPVCASTDPTLATGCAPDPSVFPTALAAFSLGRCPAAATVHRRALAFLAAEQGRHGLWRHWTRDHPHAAQLPPDLDDTACASLALAAAGEAAPDNRALLLANRDDRGLFYTWLSPRLAWSGLRHVAVTWRQLVRAPTLFMFFRATSARPRDIDAAVNANALAWLSPFEGEQAVVDHLVSVLEAGHERQCDKWYDNPFVLWYFFARALGGRSPRGTALIRERVAAAKPANALELALSLCAADWCGDAPSDDAIDALLALQQADGAWPRAAFYHGGRARLPGGGFAEPHPDTPRWGSEALTTAFCIEALSRAEGPGR